MHACVASGAPGASEAAAAADGGAEADKEGPGPYDLICGVPYTALPIATAMSLGYNLRMVSAPLCWRLVVCKGRLKGRRCNFREAKTGPLRRRQTRNEKTRSEKTRSKKTRNEKTRNEKTRNKTTRNEKTRN